MDPVKFEEHVQNPSMRLVELPNTITPLEFYVEIAKAVLLATMAKPKTLEKAQEILDKEADYVRIMQSEMLRQCLNLSKGLEHKRERCRDFLGELMKVEDRWKMSHHSNQDHSWGEASRSLIIEVQDDLPIKANSDGLSVVYHNHEYMNAKGVVIWTAEWQDAIQRANLEIMEHSEAIRKLLNLLISKLDLLQSAGEEIGAVL